MTAVKGSKQHQMVVVPYRPYYRFGIFLLCVVAVGALSWSTYNYGLMQEVQTKAEVVKERTILQHQLEEGVKLVRELRQQVADLKLGGQIDSQATEEVRQTVEALQDQIAELNEEIRFYKGVMLPNAELVGLRIERVGLKSTNDPKKFNFGLLLTQIVEKHDYVQGNVKINVVGQQGLDERQLSLDELSGTSGDSIRFRFRYFQNVDSELSMPDGFKPSEVVIIAQSTGRNSQRIEKKFDWKISGD